MKIKYNKFLQVGAYILGGKLAANTVNTFTTNTDILSYVSEPLPLLAATVAVFAYGLTLGTMINRIIINNLKKDKDGVPEINLSVQKPKMR